MKEIIDLLKNIEKEYNVKVIYAVESGSRIYGFANENSDYDVRFVYTQPIKKYLDIIDKRKDTINYMSDDKKYDLVGWNIDKALYLHYKDNPALREWILSPIIYIPNEELFKNLPEFNIESLYQHYFSIAYRHYDKYKCETTEEFKHKKYLYIFRALLSCKYILKFKKEPPVNVNDLKTYFDEDYVEIINELIKYSQVTAERIIKFNEIIESLLNEYGDKKFKKILVVDEEFIKNKQLYNDRFHQVIGLDSIWNAVNEYYFLEYIIYKL